MSASARELASKVAASVGGAIRGKLTLNANPVNRSSLSSFEFQKACEAFHDEIEQQTNAFRAASSEEAEAASVSITLAENLRGFLWIAQVTQGLVQRTFFVPVAREKVTQANQPSRSVTLQKQFLLSRPEPILDADFLPASPGSVASLLVLQPERIALFVQQNGTWQLQSQAPIAHPTPWPRDIRGRLQQAAEGEEAILPGVICSITTGSALSASCKPGSAGWLFSPGFLRYSAQLPTASADGSTFTFPALASQEFYSLAVIGPPASPNASALLIATTLNGRALLFEGTAKPVASFPDWGGDVAALYSAGRTHGPLLVTRAGDWTVPDSIQAFEIVDREAVAVSGEIGFDGPVTALWSEDENSVLAVSRNLKTGMYEAYFISARYKQ